MPKLTGGTTLAEHKAATRDAMLDAFAVELHQRPWQDLKLQTIAERAGVARTAVYNYFPDRTTLLLAWSEREMTRFMALAARELADRTDPVDRLQVLVKLVLIEFSCSAVSPPPSRRCSHPRIATSSSRTWNHSRSCSRICCGTVSTVECSRTPIRSHAPVDHGVSGIPAPGTGRGRKNGFRRRTHRAVHSARARGTRTRGAGLVGPRQQGVAQRGPIVERGRHAVVDECRVVPASREEHGVPGTGQVHGYRDRLPAIRDHHHLCRPGPARSRRNGVAEIGGVVGEGALVRHDDHLRVSRRGESERSALAGITLAGGAQHNHDPPGRHRTQIGEQPMLTGGVVHVVDQREERLPDVHTLEPPGDRVECLDTGHGSAEVDSSDGQRREGRDSIVHLVPAEDPQPTGTRSPRWCRVNVLPHRCARTVVAYTSAPGSRAENVRCGTSTSPASRRP